MHIYGVHFATADNYVTRTQRQASYPDIVVECILDPFAVDFLRFSTCSLTRSLAQRPSIDDKPRQGRRRKGIASVGRTNRPANALSSLLSVGRSRRPFAGRQTVRTDVE